jgi:hypothetical protein
MGTGMELAPNLTLLQAHANLTLARRGYTYTVETKGSLSTYTVSDSNGRLSLPIRYAFGVRNQTFVLEYDGGFYESLVSYYAALGGLAPTVGDGEIEPRNLVEAMGRRMPEPESIACFGCHSSGAVNAGKLTLESIQPGVTCEHCHAGANAHMETLAAGKLGPAPRKLAQMSAEQTSQFCGQCHRTWADVVKLRLFGEINVRFQPYRLANSSCFIGDDPRIRCTACHNPHANPDANARSYDRNCLACHGPEALPVVGKSVPRAKPCPAAADSCVSCHMPAIELPVAHIRFHDHQIRIVRPNDPYPE